MSSSKNTDEMKAKFTLKQANRSMLQQQEDCDVTFCITKETTEETTETTAEAEQTQQNKEEQKEEELPKAHMFVLKARCPKLVEAAKKGENGLYVVEIHPIKSKALCEVLRFLYTDKVHLKQDIVFDVLKTARKYRIPQLEERCTCFTETVITVPTVCDILKNSLKLKDESLTYACTDFITDNTAAVLSDNSFLAADSCVVEKITELNVLGVPELELFQKCVKWARAKKANSELVGKDLREALGKSLDNIRFPVMKMDDFSQYVQETKVLICDENVEIFTYISRPEGNKPSVKKFKTEPRQLQKMTEVPVKVGDRDRIRQRNANQQSKKSANKDAQGIADYFNDGDADSVWSGNAGKA
jgi:hypothetical protein